MREYVYFSELYGGHVGILTIWADGALSFDVEGAGGPCVGEPETWSGKWVRICEL